MALRVIYTIFFGLLLATFVGIGIAVFYTAPKAPEYPEMVFEPRAIEDGKIAPETGEQKVAREQYEADQKEFQKKDNIYNRNVSLIALSAAIILLIVSLLLANKILILADGVLLGGTLTLGYGIIRGFMTEDLKFRFILVTIGLIIVSILGYLKFVRQIEPDKLKK